MDLRELWPKKEAVREVLTEEVANKLGHDREAGGAGISRLTRAGVQRKGSGKPTVHRLRVMGT